MRLKEIYKQYSKYSFPNRGVTPLTTAIKQIIIHSELEDQIH